MKNNKLKPGKPKEWSDDELKQLALDIKYKFHGIKITPSLLERETPVGRNTWSRRMKDYIIELNKPILTSISLDEEIVFPSIELIFNKFYGNEKALKNELTNFQVLFFEMYNELQKYKEKENKYNIFLEKIESLNEEVKKQQKRALHYERLYNEIALSSAFPHIQENENSPLFKLKIKENLISMDKYKNKGLRLEKLEDFFPDSSEDNYHTEKQHEKKDKIFNKLVDDYNL